MSDCDFIGEKWKPIHDFDGYEVSNYGRVRSFKNRSVKMLSQKICKTGYPAVGLSRPGKKLSWPNVHRLVAFAFVEGFFPGADVCHENNDRSDCRACNLRWDSRSANIMDKHRHGTMPMGENHQRATLSDLDVEDIQKMKNERAETLAMIYCVSRTTIFNIWGKRTSRFEVKYA